MANLVIKHGEEFATTSGIIASNTGNEHASVIKLVREYQNHLEEFGSLGFEIQVSRSDGKGGQKREIAILNEQQATFLLTLMRNSDVVVRFKLELVKEFYRMRNEPQQIARPTTNKLSGQAKFDMTVALNMAAMDSLNMAPSGRLMQLKRIEQVFELPPTLPNYAEDNNGSANGSMEFASLTELLGEHQAGMSAKAANTVLLGIGFMKEATRPSNKSPDKIAKFKVIDGDGLKYGKNMSSTSNPRETQPMWYRETFSELLEIICENAKSAA